MRIFLKTFSLALFLLTSISIARADDPKPYEQKENVVFAESHGTALVMDIFTPKGTPNGRAIIDVVSGSWFSDRNKLRDHIKAGFYDIFCARGYTVFAPRPGSVSKYTGNEMITHVKYAIRWVRHNAAEYKVDPAHIGLTGASAGGHLACMAAFTGDDGKPGAKDPIDRESCRIEAISVFFPPADFLNWETSAVRPLVGRLSGLFFPGGRTEGKTDEQLAEAAEKISPARHIPDNPPPFLVFHGTADPLVPLSQSKLLVEALKAKGGEAELRIKEGGAHPWIPMTPEITQMADWFDQHLGVKKGNPS